ncbi:MAG: ABC transporter permease [Pseudomonadota bacterium]
MKQIILIAWREYRQYVFSRGFLLFLIMFPLGFIGVSAAMAVAENSKPTRYFVIYDETGLYTDDILEEIEDRWRYALLSAWDAYARGFVTDAGEPLPAPFAPGEIDRQRIEAFIAAGGADAAATVAAARLKPGAPPFAPPRRSFQHIGATDALADVTSLAEAEEELRPYLKQDRLIPTARGQKPLFAAILIPAAFNGEEGGAPAQYWSKNLTDNELASRVSSALDSALKRQRYAALGVGDDEILRVEAIDAPMESFRPDRAPEEAQLDLQDRIETSLPAAMTYMLLVIIFGAGNLLLTNTIEERSNKIVEILLSSVTANQLMMGKLLGIGAVGLTMPAIFVAGGIGLSATIETGAEQSVGAVIMAALFSSNLLAVYLFYFICAYLIFAMIFLAIGAISNSLQDAQSYMGPVMLLVFAPLPFMILVFQNPNGLVATVLTWIPIYTPYAVMMRAAADPPLWEIIGATALMLAFAIILMRTMGRIFRQAILVASPPKMRDVWRLAKKEKA